MSVCLIFCWVKPPFPSCCKYDAVPENWHRPWQTGMTALEAVAALEQDFQALHLLLKKDTAALAAAAVLEEAGFSDGLKDN